MAGSRTKGADDVRAMLASSSTTYTRIDLLTDRVMITEDAYENDAIHWRMLLMALHHRLLHRSDDTLFHQDPRLGGRLESIFGRPLWSHRKP